MPLIIKVAGVAGSDSVCCPLRASRSSSALYLLQHLSDKLARFHFCVWKTWRHCLYRTDSPCSDLGQDPADDNQAPRGWGGPASVSLFFFFLTTE